MKNQLLPEGFRDSLPELAFKEDKVNSIFVKLMQNNGFLLVKPPLLEFESSLFFLLNEKEESNSFRVLDPISQKMMGIRSDITLQIARISCGSLIELPRPLKICYSGDVLRVKNTSLNLSRQTTQLGAEIVGIGNNDCENEIISLMITSLKSLKIKKFFINFSMPTLIAALVKDFNLTKKDTDFVKKKFNNKDSSELEKISLQFKESIDKLFSCVGLSDLKIKKLKKTKFTKNVQIEINYFIRVIEKIVRYFPQLKIFIDPLEIDDPNYHSGITFRVFSENLKELFSGGNYKVANENCIGFSGFTESLLKESSINFTFKRKIFIPKNIDVDKKNELHKKGFITFQAIKTLNKKQMTKQAKNQKCNYYFFENKVFGVD